GPYSPASNNLLTTRLRKLTKKHRLETTVSGPTEGIMFRSYLPRPLQRGGMVIPVGLAVFAVSFTGLYVLAPDWAGAVGAVPGIVLAALAAALVAQLAMSVTHAVLTRNLRRENEQMHLAI